MYLFRSILVSVAFKITSYTKLASDLKERLWLSSDKNLTNAVHPPKGKPQKPKGKEEKAAPVEKLTVDELFQQFEMKG